MNSQGLKSTKLPDTPGVYFFLGAKRKILYVGKATSLRDRVKSYFSNDLQKTRGPLLVKMIEEAKAIDYTSTDSVLEALLLEASQIKQWRPLYNTKDKDNKSFNTVVITDEEFPQILVVRSRNLEHWEKISKDLKIRSYFGPFPHGGELREALKIIRKIFPYRDEKCTLKKKCFNAQIGLCPGVCAGLMTSKEYKKVVRRIELFFNGKKQDLIKDVEKEMKVLAKSQKFEEAEIQKKTLFALEHIHDMALIKRDIERGDSTNTVRIEAYDIAHLSGKDTVGVMVVVENGEVAKSQYRKFKIKVDSNDDTNNLREVIRRRLGHLEWDLPRIIVVDGGVGQINAARDEIMKRGFDIELVAVVKDDKHKAREIIGEKALITKWSKSILFANAEAHRFAIGYHRKLRNKGFRI